jgi:PAS domain S-box-containing protein
VTDHENPKSSGVSLDDVLITEELERRPSRLPDHEAESRELVSLAQHLATSPLTILERLAEGVRRLCRCDSAGVSIREANGTGEVFRWYAIDGSLAPHVRGTMPRDASPCGVVVDRGEKLLFRRPETHFPALAGLEPPIVEALIAPLHVAGEVIGTVWAIFHAPEKRFDAEDARLLVSVSRFAAAAYQLQAAVQQTNEVCAELQRSADDLQESEARFRFFIETVKDYAIFVMDPTGMITSWNEGATRILGYTAEEAIGGSSARLFTPEDLANGLFERELRVAQNDGKANDENWLVRKDGTRFWASGVSTALHSRSGELQGFIKIFRDLTERKASEEAIQEQERRLHVALAAARMGTWRWDIPDDIQAMDSNLVRLFGLPPDPVSGSLEDFLRLIHPSDQDHVRTEFHDAVREAHDLDVEFRVVWPDGTVRYLKDQGEVFYSPDRRALFMTGACVDITDLKLAEIEKATLLEAEQEARTAAERASRIKDEFVATLSHELRTPINAVLGWAQFIQRGHLEGADLQQAIEIIERNAALQAQLIADLLDMSRIVAGKLRLDLQSVDLAEVIEAALQSVLPSAIAKQIAFERVLDARAVPVTGDPARLKQVVWNLLTNAIKFTPAGGKVTVTLRRRRSSVELRVQDTGRGITPEFLPLIFQRFSQADTSTTRKAGGLGLGLAITKELVELHGGTITATSEGEGRGATFVIRLPITAMLDNARKTPAEHPETGDADSAEGPDVSGRRILVVDDEHDARLLVARILADRGAEVLSAGSAHEGWNLIEREVPDLIVSDIAMPGEDGFEFIKRVRSLPPSRGGDVPAIALTAFALAHDRARALHAGYDAHVSKPLDADELLACIASLL